MPVVFLKGDIFATEGLAAYAHGCNCAGVFPWIENGVTVYNLATQEHWRKKAQLPALAKALRTMTALATSAGIERVGLPRIGAGLGGLDWMRVKRVLSEVGAETKVSLEVFEQFIRARPAESE